MKQLLIVNPTAGGGRAGRRWSELGPRVGERAEVLLAPSAEATREGITRALQSGFRRVIAFGGDGTANLVISSLLAAGRGDVEVGIVPAGTASDFARFVGLPRSPGRALELALDHRETKTIDAIAVRFASGATRYCLNIASAGLSGFVDQAVHRENSGNYLLATIKALLAYEPKSCRVEVDGQPFYEGKFFVLAMANGRFFGKGMKVAPHALVDDGKLDVVLVETVPRWHLPIRLPQFLLGWHTRAKVVQETRATRVALYPGPDYPPFDLDGEPVACENAEVEILPGALRLVV